MPIGQFSNGHQWRQREVWAAGQPFELRSCTICHRSLAKSVGTERWQAVHVRLIQFDFLDAETTERWLSEKCPGHTTEDTSLRYGWNT
jgi:hypothetical protein